VIILSLLCAASRAYKSTSRLIWELQCVSKGNLVLPTEAVSTNVFQVAQRTGGNLPNGFIF
jgi:hypothetical protein